MKKLMIAAAIVCAAAFAQAASYVWGFSDSETVAPDGQYFGEGAFADATAILFLGEVTMTDGGWKFGEGAEAVNFAQMDGSNYNWGYFENSTIDGMPTIDAVAGDPITLVIVDGVVNSFDEFKAYEGNYIIGDQTAFAQESIAGTTPIPYLSAIDANQYGQADWQVINTPEPTTGLLMLFGLAGLALKRRRA